MPAAKPKPTATARGNARTRIGEAVNEKLTDDAIGGIVDAALAAMTGIKAICPNCGEEHTVRIPDFKRVVDTLTALLEQAEGRPELRQPDALTIKIMRPERPAA